MIVGNGSDKREVKERREGRIYFISIVLLLLVLITTSVVLNGWENGVISVAKLIGDLPNIVVP